MSGRDVTDDVGVIATLRLTNVSSVCLLISGRAVRSCLSVVCRDRLVAGSISSDRGCD